MFTNELVEDKLKSALTALSLHENVLRMTGLGAGEPKHFGYTCAIGFILNLLSGLFLPSKNIRILGLRIIMGITFLIGVLMSLSTQSLHSIGP
jgi:hypothetical protein